MKYSFEKPELIVQLFCLVNESTGSAIVICQQKYHWSLFQQPTSDECRVSNSFSRSIVTHSYLNNLLKKKIKINHLRDSNFLWNYLLIINKSLKSYLLFEMLFDLLVEKSIDNNYLHHYSYYLEYPF